MWPFTVEVKNKPIEKNTDIGEIVECYKCNHLIRKKTSQKKTRIEYRNGNESDIFFCPEHMVKWDIIGSRQLYDVNKDLYTDEYVTYYLLREVECDENGVVKK